MQTIETARTLLAKESPELRRAVGVCELCRSEVPADLLQTVDVMTCAGEHITRTVCDSDDCVLVARELIEDKGGKQCATK